MRLADIVVLVCSLGFLLTFFWWFLWSKRDKVVTAATNAGFQEIEIEVKGGYSPDHIVVERGKPVRLKFRREESGACTDRVLIPGLRVNQPLPAYENLLLGLKFGAA